jgi:hypothetical protein
LSPVQQHHRASGKLAAKDPWGNTRGWCPATTKISCKDFGLTWNAALEAGVTGKLKNEQILVSVSVTGIASAASGGTGSLSVLYN